MPIGIVSDAEFERELEQLRNPNKKDSTNGEVKSEAIIKDIKKGGRPEGTENVPPMVRAMAAELAIDGMSPDKVSELLNVSPHSVKAYKHDSTSLATYNKPDEALQKANGQVKDRLITKARNRLSFALDGLSKEKLAEVKPKDAASIARDMAVVIRNLEPEKDKNPINNTQFVIFAPQLKQESDYEVVEVIEAEANATG